MTQLKWPKKIVSLLYIGAVVSIPIMYNACQQGGAINSGSISSVDSLSCLDYEGANSTTRKAMLRKVSMKKVTPLNSKIQFNKSENIADQTYTIVYNQECAQTHAESFSAQLATQNKTLIPTEVVAVSYSSSNELNYDDFAKKISNDPCIVQVTEERTYQGQSTFNDPKSVVEQPHLGYIEAEAGYDIFFNSTYGIKNRTEASWQTEVAVIDSGVNAYHTDLGSQVVNFVYDGKKGRGVNIMNQTLETGVDISGHGTHVAGIIAAMANGVGIHGLSPYNTKIQNIRSMWLNGSTPTTNSATLVNAILFAVANGAKVINLSVGWTAPYGEEDYALRDAIQSAVNNGALVVMSVGNTSTSPEIQASALVDMDRTPIPAKYAHQIDGAISVAATQGSLGQLAPFSLYEPTLVEISAPGKDVLSTMVINNVSSYMKLSGTSQATPMVSASAALVINLLKEHGVQTTPQLLEFLLKHSSRKYTSMTSFVEDGNELNLKNLATAISEAYPSVIGSTCSLN